METHETIPIDIKELVFHNMEEDNNKNLQIGDQYGLYFDFKSVVILKEKKKNNIVSI